MDQSCTITTPVGRFVEANGLRIYYEERGTGKPLVLLHGGFETGWAWDLVMPRLSERFRVIAPDSRGHGRTNNPLGALSYPLMADDVLAFCDALELNRPAVGGWSDGGQIALEIGIRHPDAAGALLVGGAGYRYSDDYGRAIRESTFTRANNLVDLPEWQAANPESATTARDAHRHVYGEDHWKTLMQWCAELWLTPFGLTAEDFAKITAPTLVISGDRDPFFPVEESVEMFRMISTAELAILPGADHSLPSAQPDAFADTVAAFLGRHVSTAASS